MIFILFSTMTDDKKLLIHLSFVFLQYCFNNNPSEIDSILEIEDSKSKLHYIQKNLSGLMGLKDLWIDENSMGVACNVALIEDTKDYNNTRELYTPNYSKAFRQKLKVIKIKHNPNNIIGLIAKRVAIFILVGVLSLSDIMAVNTEAREKAYTWETDAINYFI